MKRFAVCLAFVFLCGLCYAQQTVVAVFPFVTEGGISETDASSVTRIFEIKLQATGAIRVVPRSTVDRVIKQEHIYQMSDLSDKTKTAQLQRGLNADWVVWGTVSTLGRAILITAQLIDLNSQELMGGVPVRIDRIEDAYDKMDGEIEKMTRRLTGGAMGGQAAQPSAQTAPADFVHIQGGSFTMGSPASEPGRSDNEGPQHQVRVSSFYMGKYEVTQKEWQEVMGSNPSNFKGDNLPVENVSWYEAIEYCNRRSQREGLSPAYTIDRGRSDPNNTNGNDNVKWLVTWNRGSNGYRLPTEAEWEYACRGGTSTPFSTGNNITTNHANYNGNYPYNNNAKGVYRERTWNVGSGTPNPYGLYDMHGNVWEWCWDWYGNYSSSAQSDPAGAASGWGRVLRGGSWGYGAQNLRSADRGGRTPSNRGSGIGFRLVRP